MCKGEECRRARVVGASEVLPATPTATISSDKCYRHCFYSSAQDQAGTCRPQPLPGSIDCVGAFVCRRERAPWRNKWIFLGKWHF